MAEEDYARWCIEAELGLRVVIHDDGSMASMHDLEIIYSEGARGAVEVTSNADGQSIASWKALVSNETWIEPCITGGWHIDFPPRRRLKKNFRSHLLTLIKEMEAAGIQDIEGSGQFKVRAVALGVKRMSQGNTTRPGSIYMQPDLSSGGAVPHTGDPLVDWLEEWVVEPVRADNLKKLAKSGYEHRHLFLFFPGLADAPFQANYVMMMDDTPLPTRPPKLPKEITEVWVISTWSSGKGLRWSASTGWKHFEKQGPEKQQLSEPVRKRGEQSIGM